MVKKIKRVSCEQKIRVMNKRHLHIIRNKETQVKVNSREKRKICCSAPTSVSRKYLLNFFATYCVKPTFTPAPKVTSGVSSCELLGVNILIRVWDEIVIPA